MAALASILGGYLGGFAIGALTMFLLLLMLLPKDAWELAKAKHGARRALLLVLRPDYSMVIRAAKVEPEGRIRYAGRDYIVPLGRPATPPDGDGGRETTFSGPRTAFWHGKPVYVIAETRALTLGIYDVLDKQKLAGQRITGEEIRRLMEMVRAKALQEHEKITFRMLYGLAIFAIASALAIAIVWIIVHSGALGAAAGAAKKVAGQGVKMILNMLKFAH